MQWWINLAIWESYSPFPSSIAKIITHLRSVQDAKYIFLPWFTIFSWLEKKLRPCQISERTTITSLAFMTSAKFTKVRNTHCINKHSSGCCPNALRPNGIENSVPGQLPNPGTACAGFPPAGNSLAAPGLLWDSAHAPALSEAGSGPRNILQCEILDLRAQREYLVLSYWYRHSQWGWHRSLCSLVVPSCSKSQTREQRSLSTFITLQENWKCGSGIFWIHLILWRQMLSLWDP